MRAPKGWLIVALALVSSWASAQKVKIMAPEAGAVVRGVTEVVADKPDPTHGTYAWKIARAGQEAQAEFQANTLAGLPFLWDTRVRDDKGERVYPDGEYEVTANGFDASGEFQGTASVRIRIENEIAAGDVAAGVKLQVNLKTSDVVNYAFDGDEKISVDLSTPQMPKVPPYVIEAFLKGGYSLKMLSGAGNGQGGLCREICTNGVLYPKNQRPTYIDDMAKSFTQDYSGDAVIKPHKSKDPHFALGEEYLQLPDRTLTLGARPWKSDLSVVLELFSQYRQVLTGDSHLDGFEWVQGQKCARIHTDFKEENVEFEATVSGQAYKIKGTISGTRVTYFAYEAGFPVSIEDALHHKVELEPKQQAAMAAMGPGMAQGGMPGGMMGMAQGMAGIMGMGMGGGMMGNLLQGNPEEPGMQPGMPGVQPGMPGMPGMQPGMPGMPGMQPGMPGMPGMQPGMPGMQPGMPGMPGMQPGMPGMQPGMPGMQPGAGGAAAPPQKIKAEFDVNLTIALVK